MEDISRPEQDGRRSGIPRFYSITHPYLRALTLGAFAGGGATVGLVVGLDVFFIVHVFLHLIFYNHPENRFRSVFSYVLIFGAGMFGAVDLLLML